MTSKNKKILLEEFNKLYPNPKSELNFKNDYELVVSVMLSAQSTDKKVNEITPVLFSAYKNFSSLANAKTQEIEKIIRQVNYFKTKAKHLVEMAKIITYSFQGKLPKTHEELTKLPGVGNKTANVVLSELRLSYTFPVDTHVFRVSYRLGLSSGKNPKATEEELKTSFSKEEWRNLHHWLIFHGRRVCQARNPKCSECTISKLCPQVGI